MKARLHILPLLASVLAGCGSGDAEAAPQDPRAAGTATRTAPGLAMERSRDPRVAALREALEGGRPDLARTLAGQVGGLAGAEGPLLDARLALLEGDAVGALRAIEEARAAAPDDRRVYATAAEVYALLGRFGAAKDELDAGYAAAGRGPELDRATGVVLILQPGGAEKGLAALERAREADPDLPFLRRPLSQAHLLVGAQRLGDGDPEAALEHAVQARALDPGEPAVIDLEAECRTSLLEFDRAFALLDELAALGRDVAARRAHLHKSAATFHVGFGREDEAVEHYAAARALGLDEESLGFGTTYLRERALRQVDLGIERYDAGDLAGARERFERALAIDTTCLEAENHLGVIDFREGDHRAAAERWERVLAALPAPAEPVHLNLAKAWVMAGEPARARSVLDTYLATSPDGPWAAETREALDRLE